MTPLPNLTDQERARKGVPKSLEHRAKISVAVKSALSNPEIRSKMRVPKRKRWDPFKNK